MKTKAKDHKKSVILEFRNATCSQIYNEALRRQPKGTRYTGRLIGKIFSPITIKIR